VITSEWNGIMIIVVKYIGIILGPNLMDLDVFQYLYGRFDA
jgi:hypothetical protein